MTMGSTSSPPAPRKPATSQTSPIPSDPILTAASGHCSAPTSPDPELASVSSSTIQSSNIETAAEHYQQLTPVELGQLLALRDREIRALKFELEKYKLALYQSQLDYHHYIQEHSAEGNQTTVASNVESIVAEQHNLLRAATTKRDQQQSQSVVVPLMSSESVETLNKRDLHDLIASGAARADKARLSLEGARISPKKAKVVFRTGDDDEDDNSARVEKNDETIDVVRSLEEEVDQLEDIIHDIGRIDLSSNLDDDSKRRSEKKQGKKAGAAISTTSLSIGTTSEQNQKFNDSANIPGASEAGRNTNGEDEDENEDIMTDGLLTSLTDAAISNLSQLAALQERCESQQQYHQQSTKPQHQQQQDEPTISHLDRLGNRQTHEEFVQHDPFSASSIASQAAIAISAAAAAVAAAVIPTSSMTNRSQQRPVSPSSSLSPNSTIQADLSSTQSLASVVAAAAVAAAAANQEQEQDHHQHAHHTQQQLHHHHHHHQLNAQNTSRLITSASPSSEFYHSLQQQHAHNIHSPVSSLHFSPSTSVTPSPSLLAQSRRSVASNASSSLMSPIVSPNYLRRQFMPDRLPLLSPSPTSCLTTGSSSGASSSLAHLLHHQQHRSASAFGGSGSGSGGGGVMTSASSTPLSSGGSTAISPLMSNKNSSQARLNNMQIRHKFGYLGSGRAQFNSPHGFCLGLNQEIVVADTNNHRVCIFDKNGTYITQFGSPGKEEGQLWNPRKVAILHRPSTGSLSSSPSSSGVIGASSSNGVSPSTTIVQQSHISLHHHNQQTISSPYSSHISSAASNPQQSATISSQSISSYAGGSNQHLGNSEPLYVVCDRGAERSRMQLFTKDGAFIKKIGIHYIDIVAGLAITQNGLIIVVDSVSPTVYIINGETGILNGWFDCSGHMKEPSDIAVKSDLPGNEYFICDFKGHCVVVFSEQGEYLRKIGHDNLTSYPNGIDISDDGDILVGDSHGNRFHVVVFDRNGNFVSQFECPHVKVSRCCGLKITREGYIVTLAKNNHHVLVLDTIHI